LQVRALHGEPGEHKMRPEVGDGSIAEARALGHGLTPFCYAFFLQDVEMVQMLLSLGAAAVPPEFARGGEDEVRPGLLLCHMSRPRPSTD